MKVNYVLSLPGTRLVFWRSTLRWRWECPRKREKVSSATAPTPSEQKSTTYIRPSRHDVSPYKPSRETTSQGCPAWRCAGFRCPPPIETMTTLVSLTTFNFLVIVDVMSLKLQSWPGLHGSISGLYSGGQPEDVVRRVLKHKRDFSLY